MLGALPLDDQPVLIRPRPAGQRRFERKGQGHPGLRTGQPDKYRPGREARQILPLVGRAIGRIGHPGRRLLQIKLPHIIRRRPVFERQMQAAQRQIALAVFPQHMGFGHRFRLAVPFLPDQAAHLLQMRAGAGIVPIPLPSGPQAFLVEAQHLAGRAAPDHGPQAAVADRQSLLPSGSCPFVPEPQPIRPVHRPIPLLSDELRRFHRLHHILNGLPVIGFPFGRRPADYPDEIVVIFQEIKPVYQLQIVGFLPHFSR